VTLTSAWSKLMMGNSACGLASYLLGAYHLEQNFITAVRTDFKLSFLSK
jgi:hypothetical protein